MSTIPLGALVRSLASGGQMSSRYAPPCLTQKPILIPNILLVDDDPVFCKILARAASCVHVPLGIVQSMAEFEKAPLDSFQVAILDYDVEGTTGPQLARYCERYKAMPVVLVSATARQSTGAWSQSIYDFVLKTSGPFAILEAAFAAYEASAGQLTPPRSGPKRSSSL